MNQFVGDAVLAQHLGGGVVGHAEEIARRAEPGGVHGDGIRDDGNELERALVLAAANPFDDVGVDGVGGDDAIGLGLGQDFLQKLLHPGEVAELAADQRRFEHGIDAAPEPGRVLDHAEVGLAGEGVERAVAVGKEVEDLGARVFIQQFDGVAQIARGGVVPVTESGRQDENLFHGRTRALYYGPVTAM